MIDTKAIMEPTWRSSQRAALSPSLMPSSSDVSATMLFWSLLLLYELFLFFIPLFPNVDGPVHLYLSSVFLELATHKPSVYMSAYGIRHLIQPYSLHYYVVLALEHWFSPPTAEKIFVGCIWLVVATGFRSLTRKLGTAASPASLLVFPLLFSWPMAGGFFNYTLATGLLLFALALYLALPDTASPARTLAWLLLVDLALIMSHPLPLMILIALLMFDLATQWLTSRFRSTPIRISKAQVGALLLFTASFGIPILIADKNAVAQSAVHGFRPHLHYLKFFYSGDYLSYFGRAGAVEWIGRLLLLAVLPAVVLAFVIKTRSSEANTASTPQARRLLLCALIYLAMTFIMPGTMNGSSFFSIRMWFAVWLVVIACAAGLRLTRRQQWYVTSFATFSALFFLAIGFLYLRPIAIRQAALYGAPVPQHARGLFLRPVNPLGGLTSWPLGSWDGVRAFSTNQDVLLNTPWLGLTIIPVKPRPGFLFVYDMEPSRLSDDPGLLLDRMESHPDEKQALLGASDFFLLSDEAHSDPDPLRFVTQLLAADISRWNCRQVSFYATCIKR